ncbi:HEAT repeat domain-containing protein [bacterium]|nr:HEAT repeat domain-containing protein [bacterium]
MTHFCPACWRTVAATATQCPHCAHDLRALDHRDFTDKLIAALRHPEATTQRRAARILGERRAGAAVAALGAHLRATDDPFLASDIVAALARIGGPDAAALVIEALRHPAFLVRLAALRAVATIGGAAAEQAIAQAASDPSPAVRRAAAAMRLDGQPRREAPAEPPPPADRLRGGST